MPKKSRTPESISRCCPVMQMTGRIASATARALTTGAILIASGRVPKTTRTFIDRNVRRRRGAERRFTRCSFPAASVADQRVDALGRVVGRDMRLAGLGDALIAGVVTAQFGDAVRQQVGLVCHQPGELLRQIEPL